MLHEFCLDFRFALLILLRRSQLPFWIGSLLLLRHYDILVRCLGRFDRGLEDLLSHELGCMSCTGEV